MLQAVIVQFNGLNLADDDAARQEARLPARELSESSRVPKDERIVVTDADGTIIHEEPLNSH